VVSATTGLDHVDEQAARERGVAVLSLRGEAVFLRGVSATAEHAFALLLALERRIVPASRSVAAGRWERDPFRGRELRGRRLGIVGLGRLGRQVARFGLAFGMRVGATDPYAREWLEGVERHATLDALLPESDVLTLHVPLGDETRGLIGRRELARLPQGAALVNTSRGEVLDEAALVEALESGRLAGAALDVVQHERNDAQRRGSELFAYAAQHDNLLVTPHIGGATHESMARTELFMARKLAAFLRSRRDLEVERCARSAS
jgi:D-3-phosphoglycerate dehydrogenase